MSDRISFEAKDGYVQWRQPFPALSYPTPAACIKVIRHSCSLEKLMADRQSHLLGVLKTTTDWISQSNNAA